MADKITQGFKFCKWKNTKKKIEYYENQLDTSTPTGKLVFLLIGAVAEFEKDIIHERVRADLANARRKGNWLGRPPIPDGLLEKAIALRSEGLLFRKIGKRVGVDEGPVRKKTKRKQLDHL